MSRGKLLKMLGVEDNKPVEQNINRILPVIPFSNLPRETSLGISPHGMCVYVCSNQYNKYNNNTSNRHETSRYGRKSLY